MRGTSASAIPIAGTFLIPLHKAVHTFAGEITPSSGLDHLFRCLAFGLGDFRNGRQQVFR